jgi:hypothetical protein
MSLWGVRRDTAILVPGAIFNLTAFSVLGAIVIADSARKSLSVMLSRGDERTGTDSLNNKKH